MISCLYFFYRIEGDKMTKEITVTSVDIVPGWRLSKNWSYPMQVITDENNREYIENTIDHKYAHWTPTNYEELIGEKIEVKVVRNLGYDWIKLQAYNQ
jgi:hypothetical protein